MVPQNSGPFILFNPTNWNQKKIGKNVVDISVRPNFQKTDDDKGS